MVLDSNPTRSRLCGALRLTLAALAATALGVACGGGANPPPIATVAPPAPSLTCRNGRTGCRGRSGSGASFDFRVPAHAHPKA